MAAASVSKLSFFVTMKHQNNHLVPHSVPQRSNITSLKKIQPRSPPLNISQTFTKLKEQGKVALIPFITAGDPDLSTTAEALKLLDSCGAHVIGLGVPHTDPILDGPVIQAACSRALANGTDLESVLSMVKTVIPQISCPITLCTYYNLILKHGTKEFMTDLSNAGVHGLVVPDVPLVESETLRKLASKHEIEMQLLTTPITPTAQMKNIVEAAQGCVYLITSAGVSGTRASVNPRIESLLHEIKKVTRTPVVVGFGISKPEHVQQVARWGADGVIVGSAIVKILGEAESPQDGLKEMEMFTRSLKSALP